MIVPPDHPRAVSLNTREALIKGYEKGLVAKAGLIAHGRGEAFDYLLGERTHDFAKDAIKASAATMLLAKRPVISVNGNAAALVRDDTISLAMCSGSSIEVNLFYWTREREELILNEFICANGEVRVLPQGTDMTIEGLSSHRAKANREGIMGADVVLAPLEDGDRAMALKRCNKTVITVDLNPFSRTARTADITIVDNIVRAYPLLVDEVKAMMSKSEGELRAYTDFDNERNLMRSIDFIKSRAHFLEDET